MPMCTEVTPQCPVSASTYGYAPSLVASISFLTIFGLCSICQLIQGLHYKTYTWLIALVTGTGLEAAGYVGRILLHSNVWNSGAFDLQLVALIIAPSLILGGIDLILKHIVRVFGAQYSPIRPTFYTWIFVSLDVLSLVVQAVGGVLASLGSKQTSSSLLQMGNRLLVAGIALQVAQLAAFGVVTFAYLLQLVKEIRAGHAVLPSEAQCLLQHWYFKAFGASVTLSYLTILIRCIYRLPEMAGGWGSHLQREEPIFYVLDGMMVALAAISLSVFHPGYCFPALANTWGHNEDESKVASAQ